ncbi:hypothetical protein P7K49_027682 [Saguinus oedipus]|uniref:Uncharacterized protein n=1 Tax=Saguinus oedipus TaxID=9490 RepID=A0ABQ9UA50_SAGOE|nr:hypothetical protein P7K49_027682 [Saguinus oedipus]
MSCFACDLLFLWTIGKSASRGGQWCRSWDVTIQLSNVHLQQRGPVVQVVGRHHPAFECPPPAEGASGAGRGASPSSFECPPPAEGASGAGRGMSPSSFRMSTSSRGGQWCGLWGVTIQLSNVHLQQRGPVVQVVGHHHPASNVHLQQRGPVVRVVGCHHPAFECPPPAEGASGAGCGASPSSFRMSTSSRGGQWCRSWGITIQLRMSTSSRGGQWCRSWGVTIQLSNVHLQQSSVVAMRQCYSTPRTERPLFVYT